jgi:hypothetical protein
MLTEVKDKTAQELGHTDWAHLYWTASNVDMQIAIDIALLKTVAMARKDLVTQLKKSLCHLPDIVKIIEETEHRTYPTKA